MQTRMLVKFSLVLSSMLFIAPAANAGFSTYAKDWPNDAASVSEDTVSNKTADTVNANQTPLSALDQSMYSSKIERIPETDRLYVKLGINFTTAQVRRIKNYSYDALTDLYLNSNNTKKNYASWEIGAGTKIKSIRYELEYIYTKNLQYDPSPIFPNRSENLSSKVMNTSVLLNIIWDFPNFNNLNFDYVRPYVGILGGVAWNKTLSVMQGGIGTGSPNHSSRIGFAWGFTFGARVPFWSRWMGYFGYRFTRQAKAQWVDNTNVLLLKGKYSLTGFSAGVQYLI